MSLHYLVDSLAAVPLLLCPTHEKSCSSLPWGVPTAQGLKVTWLDCVVLVGPSLHLPPSRQAWALVSVIGGGNSSCSEDVREHENHDTGGRALARRNFTTADGIRFAVTAYSEWKNGEEAHTYAQVWFEIRLKVDGVRGQWFKHLFFFFGAAAWTWKTFLECVVVCFVTVCDHYDKHQALTYVWVLTSWHIHTRVVFL